MRNCFVIFILLLQTLVFAQEKKLITLEDIYKNGTFRQDAVSGFRSMQDGRYYSEINDSGELMQMSFEDGKSVKRLADFKKLVYENDSLHIDDYAFNFDETKLLLYTENENIYRRSVLKKVYVFDLKKNSLQRLEESKVLHATFSPDGKKVAYVKDNNLYVYNVASKQVEAITSDGSYNIINGNCDWVYEEEFEFTQAYQWSPKSDFISYYRFDQTSVPEYTFAMYDNLYPTNYTYKYPKAGEPNSIIEIHSYYFDSGKNIKADIGKDKDIYIPRIKMNVYQNTLVVYKLNRLQNKLSLLGIDDHGSSSVIYAEESKTYIEMNDNIQFLEGSNAFVYTSEKKGNNHIYMHHIDSDVSTQLTNGSYEVTAINGIDESNKKIYFTSTENSPLERNVYSIQFSGEKKMSITPAKGWNDVFFSTDFSYFMKKYSYINTPPVYSICNNAGDEIRVLKDNAKLKEKMSEYEWSPLEFIRVPNAKGDTLNGWMIKPLAFDDKKQYPLLMFQYSGPGSQEVKNQFGGRDFWWYQLLAQKGYITICVDGTGTGYRGEEFKKRTYLTLGKYESDDQIAVANHFARKTYIDATRIGIWGWSYGGFMSSTCIMKAPTVFKAAIAVAPVTNWRYYDNIYTERYMRTPQANPSGYDDNSPVNMVKKLKGNFLLVHGSADDNVHLQNSMMLMDELVKNNKDVDSEIYPNKNHGISGGNTRWQLYRKMTKFLLENL